MRIDSATLIERVLDDEVFAKMCVGVQRLCRQAKPTSHEERSKAFEEAASQVAKQLFLNDNEEEEFLRQGTEKADSEFEQVFAQSEALPIRVGRQGVGVGIEEARREERARKKK